MITFRHFLFLYCETSFTPSDYFVTIRPIRGGPVLVWNPPLGIFPPCTSPELAWSSVGNHLKKNSTQLGEQACVWLLKLPDEINLVSMSRILFGRRLEMVFSCLCSYPWMKCPHESCGCGTTAYCVHPRESSRCGGGFLTINSISTCMLFFLFSAFVLFSKYFYLFSCIFYLLILKQEIKADLLLDTLWSVS